MKMQDRIIHAPAVFCRPHECVCNTYGPERIELVGIGKDPDSPNCFLAYVRICSTGVSISFASC